MGIDTPQVETGNVECLLGALVGNGKNLIVLPAKFYKHIILDC